jgi:plasmid stabilization system protein ParE
MTSIDSCARIRSRATPASLRAALEPLRRFPRLGPELGGRWDGFRFLLGPWRWMLLVYVFDERRDRVVVVTIHNARTSAAAGG